MTAARKKNKAAKIWYVSRFRQRYELADDVRYERKNPLLYTKDFVGSGKDDESCAYWRQLMALRSKANWLLLRGAFAELKNIAGNTSMTYRGYLLNGNFEPATEKEIGRWLGVDEKQAVQIITDLEDVGLLERVELPQFDTDDDGQKRRKKKDKSSSGKGKASKGSSSRARKRTGKSGGARKTTGTPGRARNPLKKKTKANVNANGNLNTKPEVDSDNPNTENNNNRQKSDRLNSNALGSKREPELRTSPSPTTAPPIMPQASDARGSRVIPFARAPSGSVKNTGPQRLGEIIKGIEHRWDADAKDFAAEIYQALAIPYSPDSNNGHRELGCFASCWMKAKATNINASALNELRARAIQEAGRLAKRKRQGKRGNVSAIWCTVFERLKLSKQCKVM